MHAATFGGNPLAARAGIATIETIERDGLLERTVELGALFRCLLEPLLGRAPRVKEVRQCGLMIGIELEGDAASVVDLCLAERLLVNVTQGNVVRLLPAMTVTDEQVRQGCEILAGVISGLT
jgi:acetylornithine/succinyldiaminopimelate/putrescine aminotransferase